MTIKKHQRVDLSRLSTMALPGYAQELWQISDNQLLSEIIMQLTGQHHHIVGGGSNLLFIGDYPGVLLQLSDARLEIVAQNNAEVLVKVAAGMNWHVFVSYCLQQGWFGLENLAAIPGTVGAAPIQNIGAYGVECAQALHSIDVINLQTGLTQTWLKTNCQLDYRDSIFKRPDIKGHWLITAVTWHLSRHWQAQLNYPDLKALQDSTALTAQHVFAHIVDIRARKLPDPTQLANVGSFFKNPIISFTQWQILQQQFADIRGFKVDNQQIKVAAAWMIEHCGWKGQRYDEVGVHHAQALVMVNFGGGSAQQLLKLAHDIQLSIWETFKIWLLPEPEFVGDVSQWQHLLQPPSRARDAFSGV